MRHPEDHLDEGTIHAWLDGALSADEARAVEEHVAGCARCAEAVAEARGLIAAASGILAKLDVVPAGVVPRAPAAPPRADESATLVVPIGRARRERRRGAWWHTPSLRVAAALLVVASGTFVVLREQVGTSKRGDSIVGFSVNRASETATAAKAAAQVAAPTPPSPGPTLAPDSGAIAEVGVAEQEAAPAAPAAAAAPLARTSPSRQRADVANLPAAPPPAGPPPAAPTPTPAPATDQSFRASTAPASGRAAAPVVAPQAPSPQAPSIADAMNLERRAERAEKRAARDVAAAAPAAAAPTAPAAEASDARNALAMRQSQATASAVVGTVRDAASGEPLGGTTVHIVGTARGAVTDSTGRFVIAGVPAGSHLVEARRIGYRSGATKVETRPDSTARVELSLPTQELRLGAQIVTSGAATGAASGALPVTARAAGCYSLAFGEWRPARPTPALPGRIALEAMRSGAPLVAPRDSAFVVLSGDGSPSAWRHSYWAPIGADSIRIVWSDGTAGVEARVRVGGRTSRGSVATFSDDERRPVQRATVTMRRAPCGAP